MRQLLLTIFLLSCLVSVAQNFYPPVVNYSTKDYGKQRNPETYCAVQDQRGVMYFGSSHGILQFDGEKWDFIKVWGVSFVRSLAIDSSGTIYCGVYGNFGKLVPNGIGGLVFKSISVDLPEEDQFFSNIWNIHATGKFVYFQAEEALFEYNSETDEVNIISPKDSYHTSFLVDDVLYLRSREEGIVKYENKKTDLLEGTEIFKGFGVFGIHKLEDDSLLIITQELGLYKWKDGGIIALPDLNETPLTSLGIFGSLELFDGNFALQTSTNGVVIIDKYGQIQKRIDRTTGIRSDAVQFIYEDRDLNLWLPLGNGISKVNYYSPLSYFDEKTGVEGNVEAIIRYKGDLFVGTSFGLFVQDSTSYGARKFRNTQILTEQVWDFEEVNGTLYIATAKGVFKTEDGKRFTQINYQNANVIVYNGPGEYFVIGGSKGIYVYDEGFKEKWAFPSSLSTFLGGEVDAANENITWLGTANSGVYKLTNSATGFQLDQYGEDGGLTDNLGKPIRYGEELIFGAKNGLFSFVDEEQMKEDLKGFLSPEELENPENYKGIFETYPLRDSVFTGQFLLLEKGKDRTWYCNEYKIGYYDHLHGKFMNRPFWGIDYGRINEFYLEDNGVLWIGATEGVIRYEKNAFKEYTGQFYSILTRVKISKSGILFNGTYLDEQGDMVMAQQTNQIPEIEYSENDIEFSFAAPYFEDEHQPQYHYMLEGYDDSWSDWKLKSDASYNNLHEGEYTFKVEARNVYGQISEQAAYSFVILSPWYRTSWAYILYTFSFVLILVLGVQISLQRLKAKNQRLEEIVEERTKEISQKNIVLEHQNKEIEDSINYAQRIQEAILPLEEEMKKWLPKSFVFFRPKDIVSGDFYWFLEKDGKLVFICADCTGHGVPGAFMSMIGSDRLNNIVSENKITSPGAILSELNRAIKKSLKQDGQKNSTRDGMDAAVCTIDVQNNILEYAGANRPLWIIDSGDLTEIKATKVAVAGFTPDDQVYTEHVVQLKPGLKFYMTTDGYADQFGGEKNKKYKVKNMKNFVVKNAEKPFSDQHDLLEEELLTWMGNFEQVDDVCVIGFEI